MTPALIPDVLYKYLVPERIDILENMTVRFSPPTDFNDTFDADYLVPTSQGQKAITTRTLLRNKLGIFCLTERPDDHLMWVHYARNHTGFALGFDANAPFFREEGRTLDKVKYREGPKVFDAADVGVCFYKSIEWKYEREWRCVRKFERSESRLVAIEPSLITHVIFGSKMEPWQIARIMLFATGYEMVPRTQFLFSTPSRKSWTFENKRKKMSLCDCCSGYGYLMEDYKSTSE
jgi:hypothetical protein